jgi:hypothetical protein
LAQDKEISRARAKDWMEVSLTECQSEKTLQRCKENKENKQQRDARI